MKVKSETEVTQSCPTLSDPMDCSPPGSSIHGIFQARVLEWVAIAFSALGPEVVAISQTFFGFQDLEEDSKVFEDGVKHLTFSSPQVLAR